MIIPTISKSGKFNEGVCNYHNINAGNIELHYLIKIDTELITIVNNPIQDRSPITACQPIWYGESSDNEIVHCKQNFIHM